MSVHMILEGEFAELIINLEPNYLKIVKNNKHGKTNVLSTAKEGLRLYITSCTAILAIFIEDTHII